jgi:hypothetical protein
MGAFKEMSDTAVIAGLVAEFAEMDRTGEQWADGLCDLLIADVGGDRGTRLWEAAYAAYTEAKAAAPSLTTAAAKAIAESPEGSIWLCLPDGSSLPWVLVRAGLDVDEANGRFCNWSAESLAEKDAVITHLPQAVAR